MGSKRSSKLVAASLRASAATHKPESGLCSKRKHILLAFVRQTDVKTSKPSLPQKIVLRPTRVCPTWDDPEN